MPWNTVVVLGFALALVFSLYFVNKARRFAIARGWFDTLDDRKIHQANIPRVGGVGIWLGFMLGFWLLALLRWQYPHGNGVSGIMAGGTLLFVMGLVDDRKPLSPYIKLGGQLLAALVAFAFGVQINTLDLPNSQLLVLNGLSLPVTVLWLVGLTNALNFIDGVDGLAGGVTTLSAITLAFVAMFTHQPVAALLAALLAGGGLGFLVFNFYPARIFMGDCGALFCGFLLACVSVTGVLKTQMVMMLLPVLILMVPILDITYSTLRRLFLGKNPFLPDADHLHHKFLKAGFSQVLTVSCFYGACLLAGVLTTIYLHRLPMYLLIMASVAGLFLGLRRLLFRPKHSRP